MKSKSSYAPYITVFILTFALLAAVAAVKTYDTSFDIRSTAANITPPSVYSNKLPILVSKTSVVVTLNRNNAQSGLVYGPGFNITSQGATQWRFKYNQLNRGLLGEGFYEPAGNITPGSTVPIRTYINPNNPNGTYTGSAVVQYWFNGVWHNGPTVKYSITLTGAGTITLGGISQGTQYQVSVTLNRSNAVYGLVYGPGFTITSQGATGWQIKYNQPTQGQGFYESSGGITPGSTVAIRTYINTNKPNGTYTGSAIVQYESNGVWHDGPTVSYMIILTGGTITVDRTSVSVTLNRSNAVYGLVYGPGFTITSQGATGWQIKYNQPTQGQGFYESSGGITPGSSTKIRTYINTNKPNGVYTGSAVVQYYLNGVWLDGPTVQYSITLQ